MRILKHHSKLTDEEFRVRADWGRVWIIPGSIGLMLFVAELLLNGLLPFVPTANWSAMALAIATGVIVIGWIGVLMHAHEVFGESFTKLRVAQTLGGLGLGSLPMLPLICLVVSDLGVLAASGSGPNEEITVIATKEERNTRRGCNYVLQHPELGKQLCLVREEFLAYPNQVPVVLSIRRNALGYRVYEQTIALAARS